MDGPVMPKRQSIEPTYDSRERGERYTLTTCVGRRYLDINKSMPDPFHHTTIRIGARDLLRGLLRRRLDVTVNVSGDHDIVEDVLELDANYLGFNCTRRDEFNVSLGASLTAFAATWTIDDE